MNITELAEPRTNQEPIASKVWENGELVDYVPPPPPPPDDTVLDVIKSRREKRAELYKQYCAILEGKAPRTELAEVARQLGISDGQLVNDRKAVRKVLELEKQLLATRGLTDARLKSAKTLADFKEETNRIIAERQRQESELDAADQAALQHLQNAVGIRELLIKMIGENSELMRPIFNRLARLTDRSVRI